MRSAMEAMQAAGDTVETMIEADGLVKKYGAHTAVNGVRFTVMRGEVFGLLGPNGAGKTTTMEMIEGLRRPDGGTAKVAGFDTRTDLQKVKEVIGVQLQSTSMFDLLKVKEILRMYASFYPKSLPVEPLLEAMMLKEKMNDRVKNLSGGQKQRLAIALALINDPQVLFLDEPTTGLDPQARRTLWDIIVKLKEQGKTIVLSTHYMDEAHILCDRVCLMDQGKVIALDTPQRLVHSLHSDSAIEFRAPGYEILPEKARDVIVQLVQSVAEAKQVDIRKDVFILYTDNLQASLIDFIGQAAAADFSYAELQTRTATLEDVFIHMTGRSLREE